MPYIYYYDITLPTYDDYLDMLVGLSRNHNVFKSTHWQNNSATVYIFAENHDIDFKEYLDLNNLSYTRNTK